MFFNRVMRAIQVEPTVFRELAEEKSSLIPTLLMAFLSSIATGIGSVGGHVEKIPQAIGIAFLGWLLWVFLTYVLGARCFPEQKPRISLRAIYCAAGFASAPGLLRLLGYFPVFSVIIAFGATLWMFAATLVAMKEVLHYKNIPRTLGVSIVGWLVYQWLLITI